MMDLRSLHLAALAAWLFALALFAGPSRAGGWTGTTRVAGLA